MTIDQLSGRYFRLQKELAAAYGSLPWDTGHIDRLTDELASIERDLAAPTRLGLPDAAHHATRLVAKT